MKSRNKIIKELKRASGKSYKECRDFLKSISWDLEGENLAYWSFIMSVNLKFKEKALSFDLSAVSYSLGKVSECLSIAVKRARDAFSRLNYAIPPEIAEILRKEAENEQRDDQVSEP